MTKSGSIGDFNANVTKDSIAWKGLTACTAMVVLITTVASCSSSAQNANMPLPIQSFNRKTRKTTWMHPRSKHWQLLDYVLVRQRDLNSVLHIIVMPSAECRTDYRLVSCKLKLHLGSKPMKAEFLKET